MSRLPAKDRKLVERICHKRLTNLPRPTLVSVAATCHAIEDARIPGLFLELGCELGGSSILISIVKYPTRKFRVYDLFETTLPATEEDSPDIPGPSSIVQGDLKGPGEGADPGRREDLYEVVLGNFRSFGVDPEAKSVTLIKGPVQETMRIGKSVAFAHVNVDRYAAVMTCLTRVLPKLSPGGSIILDDYHGRDGCRKATEECLNGIEGQFAFDDSDGPMKLTKLAR